MPPLKMPDGSEVDVSRVSKALFWEAGSISSLRPLGQGQDKVAIDTLRIDLKEGGILSQITGPDARRLAIELEEAFVPVFWKKAE